MQRIAASASIRNVLSCLCRGKALLLMLIMSLCLAFSGCAADCTCTDLLAYMLEGREQEGFCIYFNSGGIKNSISSDKLAELYDGIDPSQICESYAVCMSGQDSIFEIHIYRPSGEGKVDQVEKTLRRRLELLQSRDVQLYDVDMYEETVAAGEVWTRGGFCFLLLTDNNAAAKKRARELIG